MIILSRYILIILAWFKNLLIKLKTILKISLNRSLIHETCFPKLITDYLRCLLVIIVLEIKKTLFLKRLLSTLFLNISQVFYTLLSVKVLDPSSKIFIFTH